MQTDIQGLEVTTESPEAIAAINCFIEQSLRYGREAEMVILEGIAADPACAIAHAYAAAYYLSQEQASAWKQAMPHVQAAQQFAPYTTYREQLYIAAIAAWSTQAIDRAIALHEKMAKRFPQDVISVQQGQYHYFYRGDKTRLLAIGERVQAANPDHPYLSGMIAFGLEQNHQLAAAEAMAHHAIALNPDDPWAHHALAHVFETQGRVDEGIAWMEQFAHTWETCNSMLYTHNWWHVALYYLAKGDTATVLHLYDTHVWGRARKATPKDQVGAIALLLRLELRGISVEDRWHQLAPYLYPRLHEHALAFQDLHYVYALARAGQLDCLATMVHSLHDHTSTLDSSSRRLWKAVVLPAVNGLIAHAQNDWLGAIAHLKPVLPELWHLGGSHAQRHLFEQIYQNAIKQVELCSVKPYCQQQHRSQKATHAALNVM